MERECNFTEWIEEKLSNEQIGVEWVMEIFFNNYIFNLNKENYTWFVINWRYWSERER